MNYHIFPQDKFFSSYIEDIYSLHLEDENIFWVLGERNDSSFFSTTRIVEYVGNVGELIKERLRILKSTDKLFVSWYCGFIADAIVESGASCKLYVYLMGGEFYNDPPLYHSKWLFDRITYNQLKKHQRIPALKFSRKNPLHWIRLINDIDNFKRSKKQVLRDYEAKLNNVERIDYIVVPKQDVAEIALLKKLYPTMHACHAYGMFDQNFDLAASLQTNHSQDLSSYRLLVGNSADPTNNHADALKYIKRHLGNECQVFTILSYGDKVGKDLANKYGNKYFSSNFHPITEFMDRQQYLSFLNSMDAVIMYHNRQQAVGNIISALVMGKPVFIKSSNVVYDFIKSIGVNTIYDISNLSRENLSRYIEEAQMQRDDTILKIKSVYSKEVRLRCLEELLR